MVYLLFFCTHYPVRGGASHYGDYCGAFFVLTLNGDGYTYWRFGAALLYIHIILCMVVILVLVSIVVHSVFLLMRLLLCQLGPLVLL